MSANKQQKNLLRGLSVMRACGLRLSLAVALTFTCAVFSSSVWAQRATATAGDAVVISTVAATDAARANAPAQSPAAAPLSAPTPAPAPAQAASPLPAQPVPSPERALTEAPVIAPDYRAAERPLPELNRVGVNMSEQRPLSLREAIALALANNRDIAVARQNVRIAEFDLAGGRGVYDPRLSSSSFYERMETPATSFLSGAQGSSVTQSSYGGNLRFEGLAPRGGGSYRLDFSSHRVATNNQFVAINPQYPSALSLSYTQPLLRGLRFDQNRRVIEIAQRNLSLTDAQFRQRAIETITNVQRAYWDLVFALRNLQVQRDAVRDARAQLEHNRRLVAEGILAPIDVVAAEAQVAGFEQGLYGALEEVGRAENGLKNLLSENRQAALWNVAIVPTDAVDLQSPVVSLEGAMDAALRNRPELQQSDVAQAINEIEQRFYREQTRPQVDLAGSYSTNGIAGSVADDGGFNPFTASQAQLRERINQLSQLGGLPPLPEQPAQALPETVVGGYGQSLANLAANRFPTVRVGVQLNLPLRNRTAQAQLGRSLVEGERIRTQREQLEQLIQVDVRNALQSVRTAEARLRAAAAARSASEQQYASERRRFDAGQATLFLVLERQTALMNARGSELRAQTDLNKAIAELQRATGNALEANSIAVRAR